MMYFQRHAVPDISNFCYGFFSCAVDYLKCVAYFQKVLFSCCLSLLLSVLLLSSTHLGVRLSEERRLFNAKEPASLQQHVKYAKLRGLTPALVCFLVGVGSEDAVP